MNKISPIQVADGLTANDERLRAEILNLFQYIQRLREEMAGFSARKDDLTPFDRASDQLEAIVAETAQATNTILQAAEAIGAATDDLAEATLETAPALRQKIKDHAVQVMEACAFQDLTGQRVTKIVRSLDFVEDRVNALAEIWGRDEIETLSRKLWVEDESPDEVALEGPQLPGAAISQADIDKLFD